MDTRQLAAFCAVVERESFSQAAARLGVTQPAVSQQVRALEKRVGKQLLDRSGRRVVPTDLMRQQPQEPQPGVIVVVAAHGAGWKTAGNEMRAGRLCVDHRYLDL